jgi:hypothetical protein
MRCRLLTTFGVFVIIAILYEFAFRSTTAASGEVDMKAQPPRVYYSDDLLSAFKWRRALFGFRTHLPFGKVRLAKGTGAYVDGGRFYRRLPDGGWQDMTDTLIEYQKRKMEGNGEPIGAGNRSQPVGQETNRTSSAAGSGA